MRLPPLAGPAALLALTASLAASVAAAPAARAAYTVTFSQAGSDVVADGSGRINVNGLTFASVFPGQEPFVAPSLAAEATGATSPVDTYEGAISGPISFGPGSSAVPATTGTGDLVGLDPLAGQSRSRRATPPARPCPTRPPTRARPWPASVSPPAATSTASAQA